MKFSKPLLSTILLTGHALAVKDFFRFYDDKSANCTAGHSSSDKLPMKQQKCRNYSDATSVWFWHSSGKDYQHPPEYCFLTYKRKGCEGVKGDEKSTEGEPCPHRTWPLAELSLERNKHGKVKTDGDRVMWSGCLWELDKDKEVEGKNWGPRSYAVVPYNCLEYTAKYLEGCRVASYH